MRRPGARPTQGELERIGHMAVRQGPKAARYCDASMDGAARGSEASGATAALMHLGSTRP